MKNISAFFLSIFAAIVAAYLYMMRSYIWGFFFGRQSLPSLSPGPSAPAASGAPSSYLYMLIGVIVLILAVTAAIFYIFRSSGKKPSADSEIKEEKPFRLGEEKTGSPLEVYQPSPYIFSASALKKSFDKAEKILKADMSDRNRLYRIPWFLMLGPWESGKTALLGQGGMKLFSGKAPEESPNSKEACNWWFFDKGIVLDIAGDLVLGRSGPDFAVERKNKRLWRLLFRELWNHRPERPLDGAVLTVSCKDFIGTGNPESDAVRIAVKADRLCEKLRELQKTFGIRFPVYLLISRCDEIPGFKALCNEMPPQFAGDIFGWSSPYSTDTAFSENWISEAFREIRGSVVQTEFEIFAKGASAENRDGIVIFPSCFQEIEPAVRLFAEHLFKHTVYHEPFVFRGIYFCGDRGFFVKDAFEKKIFPEYGLARPISGAYLSRNRKIIACQLAALLLLLVGGIGIWRSAAHLSYKVANVISVMKELDRNASAAITSAHESKMSDLDFMLSRPASEEVPFTRETLKLVGNMSNMNDLSEYFILSSWFSPVHKKITDVIQIGFDALILRTFFLELVQRTRRTFEVRNRSLLSESDSFKPYYLEQSPEFIRFKEFAEEADRLAKYIISYRALKNSKGISEFGAFVESLYRTKLPPDFYDSSDYYLRAVRQGRYQNVEEFSELSIRPEETLDSLVNPLYDRVFRINEVDLRLNRLADNLETFFGRKRRNTKENERIIHDLLESFRESEAVLADPGMRWVFENTFNLGRSFDEVLYTISKCWFLGDEMKSRMEKEGEKRFLELRESLRRKEVRGIGHILAIQGDRIGNRLSDPLLKLKADIENLLKQEFMKAREDYGVDIAVPPGMRLMWDTGILEEALIHFEPYKNYISKDIKNFEGTGKYTVEQVSRSHIEKTVMDIVARALRFVPLFPAAGDDIQESDLDAEIRNFREASKILNLLMSYSETLGLPDTRRVLSDILHLQSGRLFEKTDSLLEKESLYAVRGNGFQWWDGTRSDPLFMKAFDVSDIKEMEHYLKIQRDRIRHLAYQYAEPLATFFVSHNIVQKESEKRALFKWERILSEFEKYDDKKPENSLISLEKFILFDMNTVSPLNYKEKISPQDLKAASGDIFIERRNELRRLLYYRCQQLAVQKTAEEYSLMENFFNRKLAGRFPFGSSGKEIYEALPSDIRDFYHIADTRGKAVCDMLKANPEFGLSGQHVRKFLIRMEEVRDFFGEYLTEDQEKPDDKAPAEPAEEEGEKSKTVSGTRDNDNNTGKEKKDLPQFGLEIAFRVNKAEERIANRIIEQKFSVSDQFIAYGGGPQTALWQFGEPVSLLFRWAKNSTEYPVYAEDSAEADAEKKIVFYRYEGGWSLLRFLKIHAAGLGDFESPAEAEPHILSFDIDTMKAGASQEKFPTRVFLRVRLSTTGKEKKKLLMPVFPIIAPSLEKAEGPGER